MNNMQMILDIREKILKFTQARPADGICNPQYRSYMANCSKLLEYDIQLSDIENQDWTEEETAEMLNAVKEGVNLIVGKYLVPDEHFLGEP